MKVLLDECVDPKAAKYFSAKFAVSQVQDEAWLRAKNGELARLATESFDVLFTIDGNMQHQTSLKSLSLAVVVARVISDLSKITSLLYANSNCFR